MSCRRGLAQSKHNRCVMSRRDQPPRSAASGTVDGSHPAAEEGLALSRLLFVCSVVRAPRA